MTSLRLLVKGIVVVRGSASFPPVSDLYCTMYRVYKKADDSRMRSAPQPVAGFFNRNFTIYNVQCAMYKF